jgi:peptidoglycan/LPS O-acetylase OafA/YrhL
MGLLCVVADGLRRAVPFYRRELSVEAATRLTPLDGLRGLLCFGVMFHHAAITHAFLQTGRWEETPSVFYVLLGQSSVALFFCITGYLFWSRALAQNGNVPLWSFLRARWFRIVPLYWFACAAALWIARKQIDWSQPGSGVELFHTLCMGLFTWSSVGGADINMINAGVTWTLHFEWAFYLALPALGLMTQGGFWRIAFLLIAWSLIGGVAPASEPALLFITGILAAHIARWPRVVAVMRRFYVSIAVLIVAGVMPLVVSGGYGWVPLQLTTLIFVPIACGNSIFGILNLPGLRMMGVISYSVYLLHGIFLYQGRPFLRQMLAHGNNGYWAGVFMLALAVLLFCSLTYRFIEWPGIQFEKRFRRAK